MQTDKKTLTINEIFCSIQGESSFSGLRTVFVRTMGCPLRCQYCDTTYAFHKGQKMSLEEIEKKVLSYKAKYVCITGGEPLIQKNIYPLMKRLCDLNLKLSLETSGAFYCDQVDKRVKKIIDIKTPDSKEQKRFEIKNLEFSKDSTEFKFVICSKKDFLWAEEFCKKHDLFVKSHVIYSPSYKEISAQKLAETILKTKSLAKMQIQLHKILWEEGPGR